MSLSLTAEEIDEAFTLSAEDRYDYFVEKVAESGEIWSLSEGDEWLILRTDDEECLPVWPHPAMAEDWAGESHDGCKAKAISLEVWLERWVEGLEGDSITLAVFPGNDPDGVIVSAGELTDAIVAAQERLSE